MAGYAFVNVRTKSAVTRRSLDRMTVPPHRDLYPITLLSKPGCHLCDVARSVIEHVAAEIDVGWDERDINDSPEDAQAYWDKIPVVLVDGAEIAYWRISPDRLRAALGADHAG